MLMGKFIVVLFVSHVSRGVFATTLRGPSPA